MRRTSHISPTTECEWVPNYKEFRTTGMTVRHHTLMSKNNGFKRFRDPSQFG